MSVILGKNGVNRELKEIYLGNSGVNNKEKELYLGKDGINKQIYQSALYTQNTVIFSSLSNTYTTFPTVLTPNSIELTITPGAVIRNQTYQFDVFNDTMSHMTGFRISYYQDVDGSDRQDSIVIGSSYNLVQSLEYLSLATVVFKVIFNATSCDLYVNGVYKSTVTYASASISKPTFVKFRAIAPSGSAIGTNLLIK